MVNQQKIVISTLFFLFLNIYSDLNAQQMGFTLNKYDVYPAYYNPTDSRYYTDTFHFDHQLLLTENFSMYEKWGDQYYPRVKGKFKNGRLIDSLFAYQNKGTLVMRGFFIESSADDSIILENEHGFPFFIRFPGVKNGKFTYYHTWDGKKHKTIEFKEGKENGETMIYYKGFLYESTEYKNGMRHGKRLHYFEESDKINSEDHFCYDTICGTSTLWWGYNLIGRITEYKKGIRRSEKEFHYNGKISHQTYYNEKGLKDSVETTWHKNGNLYHVKNYKNDQLNGPCEEYYESGKIRIRSNYLNDELDGKFESWYENGVTAEKGVFKNGYSQKGYKHYDEKGKYIGSWSSYDPYTYSGGHYGYVLDGVYEKNKDSIITFNYYPSPPEIKFSSIFTRSEKKLLSKYPELTIELHLDDNDRDKFRRGYIEKLIITGKINEKHREKLTEIILSHIEITSPFNLGENPSACVLHGTLHFKAGDFNN